MFASILIIVLCTLLLGYWFRFSCILLLRSHSEQANSSLSTIQGTFVCAEAQKRLKNAAQLDPVHALLQRDFEVLTYLIRHASGVKLESFEEKLLVWDYKAMRFWYAVTKTAAPEQARQALGEMASVMTILAGRLGQRAGLPSEA
jgi:hypothetical protein